MAKVRYEMEIKLLSELMEQQVPQTTKYELLRNCREALNWSNKAPPTMSFRRGNNWYIDFQGVEDNHINGLNVDAPYLEEGRDGHSRLVIGLPTGFAGLIRQNFNVPLQPMALDATEALIRATHALAGAAIEMTHVAKKFLEKK